ncbi:hypothetical protein BROUX41_002398 [Berkeleyomyces rouxiae]|uniref:uncharacterized protein n=1 Tax=Berkeleyomyces rouxiae TaxID=2035830 RepID=UPI003B80A0CA
MARVKVKTTLPKSPYQSSADRPIIITERLILVPAAASHEAEVHRMRMQEDVMVWSAARRADPDIANTRELMGAWLPPNDAETWNLVVFTRDTGAFVGTAGNYRRAGTQGWPELGYMLMKEHWGVGYATEIMKAFVKAWWELPREEVVVEVDEDTCMASGRRDVKIEEGTVVDELLVAVIDKSNGRSANVLRKNGFEMVKKWEETENGEVFDLETLVLRNKETSTKGRSTGIDSKAGSRQPEAGENQAMPATRISV